MGSQFWTWLEAIIVMGVFAGVVAGFTIATGALDLQKTSEELKKKGVMLSDSGVKIRGEGRAIASEDLADSMQRSMAKTAASGALKFRSADADAATTPKTPHSAKSKASSKPAA